MAVSVRFNVALKGGNVLPFEIPAILGATAVADIRKNYLNEIKKIANTTALTTALTNRLTARFGQLRKGENIEYNTVANWLEEEKGPSYVFSGLTMSASSTDGRSQTANVAGSLIHVRSVEIPQVSVNVTFLFPVS